jgi:hypothetical protein
LELSWDHASGWGGDAIERQQGIPRAIRQQQQQQPAVIRVYALQQLLFPAVLITGKLCLIGHLGLDPELKYTKSK